MEFEARGSNVDQDTMMMPMEVTEPVALVVVEVELESLRRPPRVELSGQC